MSVWDDDPFLARRRGQLGGKKLKRTIYGLNVFLWLLGLILLALGSYSLSALKEVKALLPIYIPSGLVVIGVFFLVLTMAGCYTTSREKLGGLLIYTILMLVLFICLIGVCGGIFAYRGKVVDKLGDSWLKADDDARNTAQTVFKCCGWNETHSFPGTKCLVNGTSFGEEIPDPDKPACKTRIVSFTREYLYVSASGSAVIGVIEFAAVLVSLVMVVRMCRNPYKNFDRDGL